MSPRAIQTVIALVFLGLGGWALLFPQSVIDLTLLPEFRNGPALPLIVGCFGAQACLFGIVALTARFTARTFAALGFAVLPFFAFNYWFLFVEPVFTRWLLLDFIGNLTLVAMCWLGWKITKSRPEPS